MHRTLLFDIDGTLVNAGGSGRSAMNRALREAFGIEPARPITFGGRTDRSLLSEMLEVHGIEVSERTFDKIRIPFASRMPEELRHATGCVLPGVVNLLNELRRTDGIRLWCMTGNLFETAKSKLRHFGLLDYFDHIVGGDHDEDRRELARRAQLDIENAHGKGASNNVVVIGDTVADVICARAIGAKVVACCTGCHSRDDLEAANPCAIVEDLSDTKSIIDLLLSV